MSFDTTETTKNEIRHFISSDTLDIADRSKIFEKAGEFKSAILARHPIDSGLNTIDPMISFFEEASTRTRFSFEFAALRLGFTVATTEAGKVFSSRVKGESIEDTARTLNGLVPSAVIARTENEGDAEKAARYLSVPLLNGGDGKGEHPTQSELDMFTIQEIFTTLGGLKIVVGGDLANGRTVRSLVRAMSRYPDNKFLFVSPKELGMREDIKSELDIAGVKYEETDNMMEALPWGDVTYWCRLQAERIKERKEKLEMIERQKLFAIGKDQVRAMPKHSILLHPMPRVTPGFIDNQGDELSSELLPEVDNDPRARYFDQSANGQPVRMGIVDWALGPIYGPEGEFPRA